MQQQLHPLQQREDFSSLDASLRDKLNRWKGLAFDGLYPLQEDFAATAKIVNGKRGEIYDVFRGTIQDFHELAEEQELHWENMGYRGDTLHQHQDQDATNLIAEKNGGGILVFGSARLEPESPEYDAAQWITKTLVEGLMQEDGTTEHIVSGAGPGVMGAANRGGLLGIKAITQKLEKEAQSKSPDGEKAAQILRHVRLQLSSIGIRINLKHEPGWNDYLHLSLTMEKFNIRKKALAATALGRSEAHEGQHINWHKRHPAIFVMEGGFGTLDETFEVLCLMQCGKMPRVPVIVVGKAWGAAFRPLLERMCAKKTINLDDLKLVQFCDNERDGVECYLDCYKLPQTDEMKLALAQREPLLHNVA